MASVAPARNHDEAVGRSVAGPSRQAGAPAGPVTAAVCGLAAAWVVGGSTGLLAHPLRGSLTWLCLGAAVVAAGRRTAASPHGLVSLLAAIVVAVALIARAQASVGVAAVALVLAALCIGRSGPSRRVLVAASLASGVLAVYHLARTSIPLVWLCADEVGRVVGWWGGRAAGRPLWVGATFAGVDFLVGMTAVYAAWLPATARPRGARALCGALAIVLGHLAYLVVLAWAPALREALAGPARAEGWTWAAAVRTLVPWNLPAVACVSHGVVAAAMFRWSVWSGSRGDAEGAAGRFARLRGGGLVVAAALAAAAFPALTVLSRLTGGLEGRKIVLYEKGFLNWLRPTHGEYGYQNIGMYGMLPTFIESLGARCVKSGDLSDEALRDADVVVLIYPNEPWAEGQLERLWAFVRRGGSLLVLGEHTIAESDGGARFNDVLAPTAMRVRFDSAMFAVGGWLHSYEALAHPSTAGLGDERNEFGVVTGASVWARWPARPLLVGRWGWADPGDRGQADRALMGNGRYDPGEKLGDLVLVAEQPFGKGRIVTFGDTSSFANGINIGSHVFTSRLFAYLARGASGPQATWRQVGGLLVGLLLVAALVWCAEPWRLAIAAIALSASLLVCTAETHRASRVLPDGSRHSPNNLAYIDSSHLEASSGEAWRPDGTMGLAMTLMRNGYLALHLPELSRERLDRAGLLVSIAPSREFSPAERQAIRDFVAGGGIFVCTVGYDRRGPSESLLADLGLHVGTVPPGSRAAAREPRPMGFFKAPYLEVDERYRVYVRFHAAWPVGSTDPKAKAVANGVSDGEELPVILVRRIGRGTAVVVGDTAFAMDKNLENEHGEPFDGLYENADFWRWFLPVLRGERSAWVPPDPWQQAALPRPGVAPVAGAADIAEWLWREGERWRGFLNSLLDDLEWIPPNPGLELMPADEHGPAIPPRGEAKP